MTTARNIARLISALPLLLHSFASIAALTGCAGTPNLAEHLGTDYTKKTDKGVCQDSGGQSRPLVSIGTRPIAPSSRRGPRAVWSS